MTSSTPSSSSHGRRCWSVARIVQHRILPEDQLEFFVRWEGYGRRYASWEPFESVRTEARSVREYYSRLPEEEVAEIKQCRRAMKRSARAARIAAGLPANALRALRMAKGATGQRDGKENQEERPSGAAKTRKRESSTAAASAVEWRRRPEEKEEEEEKPSGENSIGVERREQAESKKEREGEKDGEGPAGVVVASAMKELGEVETEEKANQSTQAVTRNRPTASSVEAEKEPPFPAIDESTCPRIRVIGMEFGKILDFDEEEIIVLRRGEHPSQRPPLLRRKTESHSKREKTRRLNRQLREERERAAEKSWMESIEARISEREKSWMETIETRFSQRVAERSGKVEWAPAVPEGSKKPAPSFVPAPAPPLVYVDILTRERRVVKKRELYSPPR